MEFVKIIWQKKYFVLTFILCSLAATVLLHKTKTPVFKAEATLLIYSPYNPNNPNLPGAPYSLKFFREIFYGLNLKNNMAKSIKKIHPQAKFPIIDYEKTVGIKFLDNSNLVRIHVIQPSAQFSLDLAKLLADSFVTQINEAFGLELEEINKATRNDLNKLRKKILIIEDEMKNLQIYINFQNVTNENNYKAGQLSSFKNTMIELEIFLDSEEKRLKEIEKQIKEEEAKKEPNRGLINSLITQINTRKAEKAAKSSELRMKGEHVFKLAKEVESLNKKLVQFTIEKPRLERERSIVEGRLRLLAAKVDQVELEAKSKQLSAKILELPKEALLVKNNLIRDLVWFGIGGLVFSIIFLWLFFL